MLWENVSTATTNLKTIAVNAITEYVLIIKQMIAILRWWMAMDMK